MRDTPDDSFDVSITSPPYNRRRNDKYSHYNDTLTDYRGFLSSTIKELIRVTEGNVYFNIQKNYYNLKRKKNYWRENTTDK